MAYKLGMTKDQLKHWISAMESGDFKFGRKNFYSDGCHCALGVLCAINDIPYYEIDPVMGESLENYKGLTERFQFDEEGHIAFRQIYNRNDNSQAGYQPVIDFLKENVETNASL